MAGERHGRDVYQHFLSSLNGDRQQIVTNFKIKRGGKKDKPGFYPKALLSHQTSFTAVTFDTLSNQLTTAPFIKLSNHTSPHRYCWTVPRTDTHSNYQLHLLSSNLTHISGIISLPMRSIIHLQFLLKHLLFLDVTYSSQLQTFHDKLSFLPSRFKPDA
jgi:hypothetical protein